MIFCQGMNTLTHLVSAVPAAVGLQLPCASLVRWLSQQVCFVSVLNSYAFSKKLGVSLLSKNTLTHRIEHGRRKSWVRG